MVELNGFSAWVVVDGTDLPQYGPQLDLDAKQIASWIPSVVGKEFTVCWKDPVGLVGTAGYLTVDGMFCGAKQMYSSVQRPYGRVDVVRKGSVCTSATTERPLTFAKLEVTDDELFLDKPASQSLGEIRLDIFEVDIEGETGFVQPGILPDKQLLHERTKKAVDHRAKLGREAFCREKKFVSIKKIRHLSTFIFWYRPIEVLLANGVVSIEQSIKRKYPYITNNTLNDIIDLTEEDNEKKRAKVEVKAEVKAEIKTEWVKTEVKNEIPGVFGNQRAYLPVRVDGLRITQVLDH